MNCKIGCNKIGQNRACIYGHIEVVKLHLNHLEKSFDLKGQDNLEWTLFMNACLNGQKIVVKAKITSGNNS